ncbi:hypothetical protein [Lacinutrix sp. Hel_I_90]|uniref:hypothetical protein n=1 Tax=Lacinutrix sp. Hel_I_90 TaxID=1249999 RepID=UPI000ABFF96C|nr:hypothetical protein [Lacinutrix sp. Hel_I_90]
MKVKKIFKIIGGILGVLLLIVGFLVAYLYYMMHYSLLPNEGEFEHDAHYINPETSILNENFKVCNENNIYQYYNQSQTLPYFNGKNGFRDYINKAYKNRNYSDSGYFNIRFIINCEGQAGRFTIHENNLDLEPQSFNSDLKKQLTNLTTNVKQWLPVYLYNKKRDAYMYISYRIENGEITEIIP